MTRDTLSGRRRWWLAGALSLAMLVSPAIPAAAAPAVPRGAKFVEFIPPPVGCGRDASWSLSDGSRFTFEPTRLRVKASAATDERAARCVLRLRLAAPAGWTFGLQGLQLSGDAAVESDQQASLSLAALVNPPHFTDVTMNFTAAGSGRWSKWLRLPRVVYRPCGDDGMITLYIELSAPRLHAKAVALEVSRMGLTLSDFDWVPCSRLARAEGAR